jgi:tRNA (mo5U34)-methyltransferase
VIVDISEISRRAMAYMHDLDERKKALSPDGFGWYPYGTMHNFPLLDRLLTGANRDLLSLMGDGVSADIGAADGDLAFFLESLGKRMHIVDNPPTNYNGVRGARLLRDALASSVEIVEADLDTQFALPAQRYGLVFFLGILYHLKNPFLILERLAQCSRHALISTRVARYNVAAVSRGEGATNAVRAAIESMPVAYLLDADECNNDATNFWIFSDAGLRRLLHRTGWDVLDYMTVGNTDASDPATAEGDERAFCLVRSRHFA